MKKLLMVLASLVLAGAAWAAALLILSSGANAGTVRSPEWLHAGPARHWVICGQHGHPGIGVQVWPEGHGRTLICRDGLTYSPMP